MEEIETTSIDVAKGAQERRNADEYPAPGPDPRTLSRDELAEKLRPRRLVGRREYRLDEPDYEIADRILAMKDPPNTDGSLGTESAFARPKFIIGPDDRRRVENPRFFREARTHACRRTARPR